MYKELVKQLRDRAQRENDYYEHSGDIINESADAIEELVGKTDRFRWIPVTERLPEPFENILVANKRGKHYDIDKGWWNGTVFNRCAKGSYHNVTHWMPLPSTEGLNET